MWKSLCQLTVDELSSDARLVTNSTKRNQNKIGAEMLLTKCRLCQNYEGTIELNDDVLQYKIYECTQIETFNETDKPKCICNMCNSTIQLFHNYLKQVQRVNDELTQCTNLDVEEEQGIIKDDLSKVEENEEEESKTVEILITAEIVDGNDEPVESNQACDDEAADSFCTILVNDTEMEEQEESVIDNEDDENQEKQSKQRFSCTVCDKSFDRRYSLQRHEKTHEAGGVGELDEDAKAAKFKFSCSECDRTFDRRYNFDRHVKTHELLFCEVCNTLSKASLQHKCKEINAEGTFKCSLCDLEYNNRPDFIAHKQIHYRFDCEWPNCKKRFKTAHALKVHAMKHEGDKPFLCIKCGKAFITKNSLIAHEKMHANCESYKCGVCDMVFGSRSNMRSHEKKHHEGMRYHCSQCTRDFISKSSLERHELVHTGKKDFQCEMCPMAFYTNKELLKHQRYHLGIRLYKCDICTKSFFEKHHLTIHIRRHNGIKPYMCKAPGCTKSFPESQKLRRHMQAKHACSPDDNPA